MLATRSIPGLNEVKFGPVLHFLGALLVFIGAFMLLSVVWALYYHEAEMVHFAISAAITSFIGYLLWKFSDHSLVNCECGTKLRVPPEFKGDSIRCPHCGTVNPLPVKQKP